MDVIYNARMGRAMRFCDVCGVAMGLMTRKEYAERYIWRGGLCPICGKPAIKEDKKEVWLSISDARDKYGLYSDELGKLIRQGKIRWRPGHYDTGGRQVPEREVLRCIGHNGGAR